MGGKAGPFLFLWIASVPVRPELMKLLKLATWLMEAAPAALWTRTRVIDSAMDAKIGLRIDRAIRVLLVVDHNGQNAPAKRHAAKAIAYMMRPSRRIWRLISSSR